MIVLRTPKGWTGPAEVDGLPVEGTWRAHQVPLAEVRTNPAHLRQLEEWLRSYRPEELFDADGAPAGGPARPGAARATRGSARPRTRTAACCCATWTLPDFRDYAVPVTAPGAQHVRADPGARRVAARRDAAQRRRSATSGSSARTRPSPTGSARVLEVTGKTWEEADPAGRRAPGARRPGDGDPVRAHLPGLAGGLPADRPARPVLLLRGVHPHRRLDVQPARQVAEGRPAPALAAPGRVAELPAHLARLAPGPQRLLAPGPRLHRPRGEQEGRGDPGLPAAGREHAAVGRRPLPAQPRLRQRDRRRQAAEPGLAGHGRRDPALHPRRRDLGVGQQRRRRRRARRGAGLRRRRADPGGARRHRHPARASCPTCGSGWSTWST